MSHDGDAADAQLLARGEHARLLAQYEPVILGRCIAELRGSLDADDVAQDVKVRLWGELTKGKSYAVPFRVVVHKVIGWTLRDHWGGRPTHVALPEDWEPADSDDGVEALLDRDVVASMPLLKIQVPKSRPLRANKRCKKRWSSSHQDVGSARAEANICG
jgi:DNA-directed RNA polymerase specialized sigma24 family protein